MPADDLSQDNTWYFTIEKSAPFEVVLLDDSGEADDSLFFRQAMASGENLPFRVKRVPVLPELDPVQTPVVVLSDLPSLPDAARLEQFVSNGEDSSSRSDPESGPKATPRRFPLSCRQSPIASATASQGAASS